MSHEFEVTLSIKLTGKDCWITIPYAPRGYIMARQISSRLLHPSNENIYQSVQLVPTGCMDVSEDGYIAEIYVPEDRLDEWRREFQA
jgi:hypothetical protein